METRRRLRKVGGSTMLPIPPELLAEAGLAVGDQVVVRSAPGRIEVEHLPAGPDPELVAFAKEFSERYRQALQELADR